MRSKDYSTIDELVNHLTKSGIEVNSETQKQQLINNGYYHGYKGYRFFKRSQNRINFSNYSEVNALIEYDSCLKTLFYSKLMFIETALKSVAIDVILQEANSSRIDIVFNSLIESYRNAPQGANEDKKRKCQQRKLSLQNTIQSNIFKAYKNQNPKITHFYNNLQYNDIPLWAIFEILMLGDFGFFISCLDFNTRKKLSTKLKYDVSGDTNREVIYKFIYILKDLRNAVAHNDVIHDTRFKKTDITAPIKVCLQHEIGLPYVNFKSIIDYIILVSYILIKLEVPKNDIEDFITQFENALINLSTSINSTIYSTIVHPDTTLKISKLRSFIKNY